MVVIRNHEKKWCNGFWGWMLMWLDYGQGDEGLAKLWLPKKEAKANKMKWKVCQNEIEAKLEVKGVKERWVDVFLMGRTGIREKLSQCWHFKNAVLNGVNCICVCGNRCYLELFHGSKLWSFALTALKRLVIKVLKGFKMANKCSDINSSRWAGEI